MLELPRWVAGANRVLGPYWALAKKAL
jgi:hypothetical protein